MPSQRFNDGEDWGQDVQSLAYQVWAFQADRVAAKTARILADVHGYPVPARTVQRWAKDRDWLGALSGSLRDLSPGVFERTKFDLLRASEAGGRYLRDILAGAVGDLPPDLTPTVSRDLINAATAALDRVGFSPWSKVQQLAQHPASMSGREADTAPDHAFDGLSDAELRALAAGDLDPLTLGDRFRSTYAQVAEFVADPDTSTS